MPDSPRPALAGLAMLWVLFFLISAGLAYPTLRRYDPRDPRTNFDTATRLYHWQVTGEADEGPYGPSLVHFRYRVLVPLAARPVYTLAKGHVGDWDAGYFALLVSNSVFCAGTSLLIFVLAQRALGAGAPALVAALLYLGSFAVPNYQLAGLVDSGEAFALTALLWALDSGRRWWLIVVGVIGALAKETFVPFSVAFVLGWGAAGWLEGTRAWKPEGGGRWNRRAAGEWIGAGALVGLAGLAALMLVFGIANGRLVWPWELAPSGFDHDLPLLQRATRLTRDVGLLYVFGWLLPFGIFGLGRCPRQWIAAALAGALAAVALGIFNAEPGLARSLFNILGPLLSIASAATLARTL